MSKLWVISFKLFKGVKIKANSLIKGKENPWFYLLFCDKGISIRYTVD